ncbi:galactose-1-epimerase [Pedobacter sp. HMF7647]|uniref:Aldose 1-epimerase n=1 Tax=Hufsiella arboris TaxID=2695275 RepID=A0A7K1Y865_9SPHI|nr:aldose epimerase family protein [Hufsiella arboris]MXV50775.1 galactose-1-epimerase [Hufsiella arboris]
MLSRTNFQKELNGKKTDLFTLRNKSGMEVAITNFGGRIVSILVPANDNTTVDVVAGLDSIHHYENETYYLGALIGRYGNRIAKGRFSLNGETYSLAINNGENALHGGSAGFHNQVWDAEQINENTLKLHYLSKDGEEGFPGNLAVTVIYTVNDDDSLEIDYKASTDKTTVLNLTNHTYFNLNGDGSGAILDHLVTINADRFTPSDETQIPIGIETVEGTPLDFRRETKIGERIDAENKQLEIARGYDHNYVLNKKGNELSKAASVTGPKSGITMEVYTTEPGMQFYTGNFLDGKMPGKSGKPVDFRTSLCLETQHFPDSPNHPEFPTTTLNPGEIYKSTTIYKFLS